MLLKRKNRLFTYQPLSYEWHRAFAVQVAAADLIVSAVISSVSDAVPLVKLFIEPRIIDFVWSFQFKVKREVPQFVHNPP